MIHYKIFVLKMWLVYYVGTIRSYLRASQSRTLFGHSFRNFDMSRQFNESIATKFPTTFSFQHAPHLYSTSRVSSIWYNLYRVSSFMHKSRNFVVPLIKNIQTGFCIIFKFNWTFYEILSTLYRNQKLFIFVFFVTFRAAK